MRGMPGIVRSCWFHRGCSGFDSRVNGASGEEPREGQQGTGWVGRLPTGLRVPGACGGGLPPGPLVTAPARQGRVSAHGGSGSSVAASPGASPAGLSRRPPYAGARARPHRLPGTRRAPLRRAAASTAVPARAHRPRPPPPAPAWSGAGTWRRRDPSRGSGVGAASTARAPVAGASGRVRAAGAGRTCVCLCRSRTGGRAPGRSFSEGGPGGDLRTETVRKGPWPLVPL